MNTFSGHLSWCLAYLRFPRIIWKSNLNRCPFCPFAACSVRTFCFKGGSVTHLYRSHQVCESVIWQWGRGLCYLRLTCSEEVTHHPLRDLGKDSHIILFWSTCPWIPILWNSNSCFLRDNLAGSNPEQMKRQYSTWHNGALQDPPHPPMQLFLLSLNFKYKHVHGWTATQERQAHLQPLFKWP